MCAEYEEGELARQTKYWVRIRKVQPNPALIPAV